MAFGRLFDKYAKPDIERTSSGVNDEPWVYVGTKGMYDGITFIAAEHKGREDKTTDSPQGVLKNLSCRVMVSLPNHSRGNLFNYWVYKLNRLLCYPYPRNPCEILLPR